MSRTVLLSDLSVGDQAIVTELNHCSPHYRRQLTQMGIVPNTRITVTRKAPLGDPIEINLRGHRISLRKKEASALRLTRDPNPTERQA